MKAKSLLLTGVLALMVIGCIVAAGCTSTTTSTASEADEQIAGIWVDGEKTFCYLMNADKTGMYYKLENGTMKDEVAVGWIKNADGTYSIIKGEEKTIVTLDPVKGQFTTTSGSVFAKQAANTSGGFPIVSSPLRLQEYGIETPATPIGS